MRLPWRGRLLASCFKEISRRMSQSESLHLLYIKQQHAVSGGEDASIIH